MDEKRDFVIKDALDKDASVEVDHTAEPVRARDAWHEKQRQQTGTVYYGGRSSKTSGNTTGRASGKAGKSHKAIWIFLGILLVLILLAILVKCSSGSDNPYDSGAGSISDDYIGVLHIEGEITAEGDTYNQEYVIDALDGMIDNDNNKALLLYINTPGGGVYESDETYLKIREYQKKTKRPVYAYMASQATSGGYYISAPSDRIMANRNCWTGSIGVTIGTLIDASELLEKYGIKTNTITSGAHKDMGSSVKKLTKEERQIWQELVDEAYEQFVSIVAEGRALPVAEVKRMADGRIYSAKQAKESKLIDDVVNTYEDAQKKMKQELHLQDCEFYDFEYEAESDFLSSLIESTERLASMKEKSSDLAALTEIMDRQNQGPQLQYLCEMVK